YAACGRGPLCAGPFAAASSRESCKRGAAAARRKERAMLGNRPDTPAPRLLRVDRSARPGWNTGQEQPPGPGQMVYCTEGMAEVVRVAGKTGDGSRLLELRLLEKEAPPFYAAASNVLVMPADGTNGAAGVRAEHAVPGHAEVGGNGAPVHPVTGMPERPVAGADAYAPGDAEAGASDDAAVPGSSAPSGSVFLDSSWALDGSFVPGSAPLPGSIAKPERASPDPEPPPAAEPAASE